MRRHDRLVASPRSTRMSYQGLEANAFQLMSAAGDIDHPVARRRKRTIQRGVHGRQRLDAADIGHQPARPASVACTPAPPGERFPPAAPTICNPAATSPTLPPPSTSSQIFHLKSLGIGFDQLDIFRSISMAYALPSVANSIASIDTEPLPAPTSERCSSVRSPSPPARCCELRLFVSNPQLAGLAETSHPDCQIAATHAHPKDDPAFASAVPESSHSAARIFREPVDFHRALRHAFVRRPEILAHVAREVIDPS